jgi:hypothetical protein
LADRFSDSRPPVGGLEVYFCSILKRVRIQGDDQEDEQTTRGCMIAVSEEKEGNIEVSIIKGLL